MIRLSELRYERREEAEAFAEVLEISTTTLTRIESAERQGRKHRVSYGVRYHLLKNLKTLLGRDVALDDLASVEIVPPRPGRPKKSKEAK